MEITALPSRLSDDAQTLLARALAGRSDVRIERTPSARVTVEGERVALPDAPSDSPLHALGSLLLATAWLRCPFAGVEGCDGLFVLGWRLRAEAAFLRDHPGAVLPLVAAQRWELDGAQGEGDDATLVLLAALGRGLLRASDLPDRLRVHEAAIDAWIHASNSDELVARSARLGALLGLRDAPRAPSGAPPRTSPRSQAGEGLAAPEATSVSAIRRRLAGAPRTIAPPDIRRVSAQERATHRDALRALRRTLAPLTRRLAAPLVELLTSSVPEACAPSPRGRRLDPRALALLVSGTAPREVWLDTASQELTDVAVVALIDCSGSMRSTPRAGSPSRLDVARACAVVMHEALAPAGIPLVVAGFSTRIREDGAIVPTHTVFKDRDEGPEGLMAMRPERDNLDGVALRWAADLLDGMGCPRRILVVFSDGQPEGGTDRAAEARGLTDAVVDAEARGITVLGIGVQSDAVARFYSQHAVVNHLDALPEVVLSGVRAAIVAGAAPSPSMLR